MNKIITLVFLSVLLVNMTNAQEQKKNWIGLNASVFQGDLIRYGGPIEGGSVNNGKLGFLIGIGYSRVISNKIDLETGINFSWRNFNTSYVDPLGPTEVSYSENVDLITIPLNIKIKFRKQFSLAGGIEYDQSFNVLDCSSIDSQTGIGVNIKFGRDFRITDKMRLYLAPEIIIHDVIPFSPERFQQRLTEFGLRLKYEFGI